jgi:hypothetical protein
MNSALTIGVMKTSAPPISVYVTGQTPTAPTSDGSVVVNIVTNQSKSAEERIYLRWSTDRFVTSHMTEATGSGVDNSAVIPAQPAGTSVQYCITTSTVDLSQVVASGVIDFLTLSTTTNSHFVVAPGTATPTPTATVQPSPTPTPTVEITVQTNPTGCTFTVDGATYNSTQTFWWTRGSSHTIGTTSPQNGNTGVRYVWTRWSDGRAISPTVAPATNQTYTANFSTQYHLTMSHGSGRTVTPARGWRNSGATVSISAAPATGYHFTNWSGSGIGSYTGTNNPASIRMDGPTSEMATFTHN